MPMYDYKCPQGHKFQVFSTIAAYQKCRKCPECEEYADRLITGAPMVKGDYAGYSCPITGAWIEGRRAHEENLKKHGCRVLEPGETQQAASRRQASEDALEKAVENTAEEFVANLPQQKREQLAAEMDNGADLTVVRQ